MQSCKSTVLNGNRNLLAMMQNNNDDINRIPGTTTFTLVFMLLF